MNEFWSATEFTTSEEEGRMYLYGLYIFPKSYIIDVGELVLKQKKKLKLGYKHTRGRKQKELDCEFFHCAIESNGLILWF